MYNIRAACLIGMHDCAALCWGAFVDQALKEADAVDHAILRRGVSFAVVAPTIPQLDQGSSPNPKPLVLLSREASHKQKQAAPSQGHHSCGYQSQTL